MQSRTLKIYSYIYLILPVLIFFIGYLKPIISIPISIGICFMLFFLIKQAMNEKEKVINKKNLLVLFIIILIICILAGQGGLFYQSADHHWRNAIFRDLVNFEWPVYYSNFNSALNYYIGHWIVPASIGKIFVPISQDLAWQIANISLLIWSTIGVTLSFLWLVKSIKMKKNKSIFLALFIFMFFSGLDILGTLFFDNSGLSQLHLEWWATNYQFSSMTTQLFWVFNQSIVAWLISLMFINEKSVKNFFVLIILCLPYSPLPFAGLIILFAYRGFEYLIKSIKNKNLKSFFKDVFSIQNIISIVCILPIYYFYYTTNSATSDNGFRILSKLCTTEGIFRLLVFWFLEIGIYGIIIFPKYKKNGLFYASFLSLLIIPLFAIGGAYDFAMRASIPSITICMYFVIKYLIDSIENNNLRYKGIVLISVIILGTITSFFEYGRAINTIKETKTIRAVADRIVTFSDKNPDEYSNFMTKMPEETFFFKYIVKSCE